MRNYLSCFLLMGFILVSTKTLGQTTSNPLTDNNSETDIIDERTAFDEESYNFSFFDTDFNFISFTTKNIHFGFNGFFEEDLPANDLKITDFLMYNLGFNYTLNRLQISLFIENFFNLKETELNIEPAYVENNNTLVYLEHDIPSIIRLSLVYSF